MNWQKQRILSRYVRVLVNIAMASFLLLPATTASAQTVTDPLATALVNAGLDPAQAGAYATALEMTFANQKAIVSLTNNQLGVLSYQVATATNSVAAMQGKQTTDEATITAIQTKQTADEGAITAIQAKQTVDEGNISSLLTSRTTDEASIATLKGQVATLQSQELAQAAQITSLQAAMPISRTGTAVLVAGTASVNFSPAMAVAPKQCQLTPTAAPVALAASTPSLTGFTITSANAADTQSVGYSCQ